MSPVNVGELKKNYGNLKAVDNVTFEAEDGKILTILGPSGSGKTTLLRCISGIEIPESGEIKMENQVVFSSNKQISVPPEKRRIGMVFQSYAIWPNMTVFDNVAFPLKVRKISSERIKERVDRILSLMKLQGVEQRPGFQLSAGQQQRVALARALVFDPKLLLLDEPLSNLDAKLREYMRVELKELQRKLSITTIFVTHDHGEAFALSDKIMVVHEGRNVAFGTPKELYQKPPSLWVAEFLGHSNILPARVVQKLAGEISKVETPLGTLHFRISAEIIVGDTFHICLRGRMINLRRSRPSGDVNLVKGILSAIQYRGGDNVDYVVSVRDSMIHVHGKTELHEPFNEGEEVYLEIPVDACTTIRSL